MRTSYKVVTSILVIFTIVIALPVIILFTAPDYYRNTIESWLQSSTGLDIQIESLDVDSFPLWLELRNVTVSNPELPPSEPMLLSLEQLSASLALLDWLQNKSTWWSATASGLTVRYSSNDSGQSNWTLAADTEKDTDRANAGNVVDSGDNSALFAFDVIDLAQLRFIQGSENEEQELQIDRLTLDKSSDESINIDVQGNYQEQPVTLAGSIPLPSSDQAREIDLNGSLPGIQLQANGTVNSDGITPGSATFSLQAEELSSLTALTGTDFKAFSPLTLIGTLDVPEIDHWQISLNGTIAGEQLQANAEASKVDGGYNLQEFSMDTSFSSLTGSGQINLDTSTLNSTLDISRLNLNQLMTLVQTDTELGTETGSSDEAESQPAPDSQPSSAAVQSLINGSLKPGLTALSDVLENWSADLDLHIAELNYGDYQFSELTVSTSNQASDLQLELQLKNVETVSTDVAPEPTNYQTLLPLQLTATLQAQPSQLSLSPLEINLGRDRLHGQLQADLSADPVRIEGELNASRVDIDEFATTSTAEIQGAGSAVDKDSGDVISDLPLDWSWLQAAELDLSLNTDVLRFNQTDFHNVTLEVALADGTLTADPINADLSKGGVRGSIKISQTDNGAELETNIVATELTPADLGQPDEGLIDGGETDLAIQLTANGATPQQLARTLNGEIALEIQRATIRNSLVDIIGSDVVTQFVGLINPFSQRDDQTDLECAAFRFVAEDGVVTSPDQLVIETSKMKIRGGGEINLHDETLRVDFVPSARSGLGISLGNLASVVRLGGTLGNPTPEADPAGILRSGATIGAAIATGGLSLLAQGLFDRARNQSTACGQIFEENTDVPDAIETSDNSNSGSNDDAAQ